MDQNVGFSRLANAVVSIFEKESKGSDDKKVSVNAVVSKVASWYEKFRNAMDYREEEVILRAAIERILKRRILLGGIGKTVSEPLVRELVWARYFPNESLPETVIPLIEEKIDVYLQIRHQILMKKILNDNTLNDWIFHLLSSDIEKILNPNKEKEVVSNFMYQIMRQHITIADDNEQNRDAQVFIAVRKGFAKDDLAFLRFHLFTQFFGKVDKANIGELVKGFKEAHEEIEKQLSYSAKDRIYSYVLKRASVFFILEGLLRGLRGNFRSFVADEEEFKKAVFQICENRYNSITSRVRRAIIRSVVFILLTKAFFALAIEGTYEKALYGRVLWNSILLNTTIPPMLMIIVGLFIKAPGKSNSERVFLAIKRILFEEEVRLGEKLIVYKHPKEENPTLNFIFRILWLLAFVVSFGIVIFILRKMHFTVVSQGIFLFFLAIVSFLTYRIALIPKQYTFLEKEETLAPIVDFFFMPIIRVGRHLTEGISQINIILFIFDFIIETPFKGIFAFFEQWFFFLRSKREELG